MNLGETPQHLSVQKFHENRLTTKLSDAGGPARPNLQANDSARIRSSDFVARHSWFQLSDD
jgi:hypothetical protein